MSMRHMSLGDFQFEVGTWAERTFAQATDESIIAHLRREVTELLKDCKEFPDHTKPSINVGYEAADVFLLLLHLCHRRQIDLMAFSIDKFLDNQARTWGKPDHQGVGDTPRPWLIAKNAKLSGQPASVGVYVSIHATRISAEQRPFFPVEFLHRALGDPPHA